MSMFKGNLAGYVASDATIKQAGGNTVCEFSIPHRVKKDDPTTWVRCTIWGDRGTKLLPMLTKGTPVSVVGSLTFREFEGKNGKQFSVEMRVDDVALLGRGSGESASSSNGKPYGGGHGGGSKHHENDDADPPF